MTNGCYFTSCIVFNLAHWIFAFSHLVLSYRFKLIAEDLPEETYNCRLKTVNLIVCLINVAIQAIVWLYDIKEELKVANIAFIVDWL